MTVSSLVNVVAISSVVLNGLFRLRKKISTDTALVVACETYQAFSLTHPATLTVTATDSPPLTVTQTPSALVQSPATEAL